MMTEILRRRRPKATPETPPSGLNYILSNPVEFIRELQSLVKEADERRASVLIDALKVEHPDLYRFAESLVDVEPELARDQLVKMFPWLGLIKLYPDHLRVIAFLQNQIRLRREGDNLEPNQNIKR